MATFYIEAVENTQIALVMVGSPTIGTVKYGVNDSTCPNTYTVTTESTPISLTAGQKCYWTITSTSTNFSDSNYLKFTSSAKINVGGNMSDLIGGATKIPRNYCFSGLFNNCTNLVDASNLIVVDDFNSKTYCYQYMFQGCTSLITPPELPTTTLASSCYGAMFSNCTSLTTAPALPATTLAASCYSNMFYGCTSLTTPPALPATTLTDSCYFKMFYGCTSLTTAPELPATTLADSCYYDMFRDCKSLTTPPELPATTLAYYCYFQMFYGCKSLTTAPELPATTLADSCYCDMFRGCTSLTTPPELPATTLASSCYSTMFYGCKSLTTPPELPATTLANECYYYMFYGCKSLTIAPELPATTLANRCYDSMLRNCTSLTTPPTLPATTLTDECYYSMFNGCTNIKLSETQTAPYSIPYRIPSEGTGTKGTDSLTLMFYSTGGTFKGTPTINTTYYLAPYATFYIEAVEDTNITLSKVGTPTVGDAYYGVENHNVPNAYTYGNTIHLTAGQKCYWFVTSTSTDFSSSNYLKFTSTAKINVGGNLSDLIGGDTKIPRGYCFNGLFYNCARLIDASNLVVVNDFNSKTYCYSSMFQGCTSLTTHPELPATTLATHCYSSMFWGCTSLTTAPELPATTLKNYCYSYMFASCTSLTTPPELPATTLAIYCYQDMFEDCTSLTTPPELPATTLADGCYYLMFNGCTNIKLSETQTAPYSIPYRIPSEGTGTKGTSSLADMFFNTGGTFTGTPTINKTYYLVPYATFYIEAVEDTDITLSKVGSPTVGDACYGIDDHGVSNVYNYGDTIHLTAGQKCYWFVTSTSDAFNTGKYLKFTSTAKINVGGNMSDLIGGENKIPRNHCFRNLFDSCTNLVSASNLVLVNNFNLKGNCYNAMFSGCTSLTTAPELPATTLATSCYDSMFSGCTSLTTAPALPATTLAGSCYNYMFQGCTSLTTAPELPATTLTNFCYYYMFNGCTSLTIAPELPATTLTSYCYQYMFNGCTSLTTLPALPATTLASYCYGSMFNGCTNIKLSETQTAPYLIPYRIPSEGTGTVGTSSLTNMFTGTGGTFKGTPTINKTYYLAPPSSPIYITYKGQELANFETGSKTIKCGGKYMEGDVIIAREIGTNNVVVLYNSATILTFQNGTKTLKCAGKGMATDLVIQTS